MNTFLVTTCGAAAVTAACVLVADLAFGQQQRIRRRVQQATKRMVGPAAEASALFRGFTSTDAGSLRLWDRVQEFIRQSGLRWTAQQVLGFSLGAAAISGAVAGALNRPWLLSWGVVIGGLGLPWLLIGMLRRRRILQITHQLPDAFDIMRRAVQAGQTVPSALQMSAVECRQPLAQELALCCEQQNLGLPYDATLRDFAQRVPIVEVQIFALAMMVQRQFGSNPVEILANLSDMIRKRTRLARRVQALTGEGRLQAIVLTILPIGVFVWLVVFRPEYIQTLIDRPKLLAAVASLQIVGTVWIRRTIRIEY